VPRAANQAFIRGTILRTPDLAPLAGAHVVVRGPAEALAGVPGSTPMANTRPVTWTRVLQGFTGTRWQCWVAHVRDTTPGLTWEQFRDGVVQYNPQLQHDGMLFQRVHNYFLPEQPARAPYSWTRTLNDFGGTRWECWVAFVRDSIPGITWDQFRDDVLRFNPHLNADGRLFLPDRSYLLPQIDARPRAEVRLQTGANGTFALEVPASGQLLEITATLDGFNQGLGVVPAAGLAACTITLSQRGARSSGTIRSALASYAQLTPQRRAIVDAALALLGDDRQSYDALPSELRPLCFGHRYISQPANQHYKDIVCADVVSIALRAAGCELWPGNTHLADYYHPARSGGALLTIEDSKLLPGDILVFGNGAPEARAMHVAIYVGPF
jgi:hypothetical protein